jgi:8-oxo-dGTP pyrophosphatase MutT (NUDIX family)
MVDQRIAPFLRIHPASVTRGRRRHQLVSGIMSFVARHEDVPGPRLDPVAEVRRAVAAFDAATVREIASRDRFLAELDRLAAPFDRYADPVHVTGSAIVAGPRGTVLHLHKRLGGWMQPGGHVDPGETPWQAAVRETLEETGLAVRHPDGGPYLIHIDAHPAGAHVHLDLRYLLLSEDIDPSPPPGESPHVRWFSLADAIGLADEALVDGLRRLRASSP